MKNKVYFKLHCHKENVSLKKSKFSLTYLLTYAYSPAGGIGHRQQHANRFGPGPVFQLGFNCSPSLDSLPLGPFSKCSWVYISFSFPGGSRSGPDVLWLKVPSLGYAQSISIFFFWFPHPLAAILSFARVFCRLSSLASGFGEFSLSNR